MERDLFSKTAKLFSQALFYRIVRPTLNELMDGDLTEVQLACLRFVFLHPDPSVGAIADGLSFSNAASAKLVDRLVKKKLLSREEDQQDRRVLKIKLTPEGQKLLDTIEKIEAQQFDAVLQRLSPEEHTALETGLTAFLKAALQEVNEIEEICLRCGSHHVLNCPGNVRYRELTGKDKTKV
jgi:DNA-binding MarR family transcriptional regulator